MRRSAAIERLDTDLTGLLAALSAHDADTLAASVSAIGLALRMMKPGDGEPTALPDRRRLEALRARLVDASRRVNRMADAAVRRQAHLVAIGGKAGTLTYRAPAKARGPALPAR
jgi:hypothetical protein